MVDRTVKKSGNASPLVMGFASFKIVYIFIISDVSAKAQGKTQIAAKSLSQGAFQLHILLPCRRLPGRGQELLHVPAHGGIVLLLPPRLLTLGGQRRPPFFIRVWDGLACRLGRRFKALHALRSPPETRAPASNFDCSGRGLNSAKSESGYSLAVLAAHFAGRLVFLRIFVYNVSC